MSPAGKLKVARLRKLTAHIGNDSLLTQASTGNTSAKIDAQLWIKASGRWMAHALREDIFVPLNLSEVRQCVGRGIDPAERFEGASLETAMHAVLPHPVVAHMHSVNVIALAVRSDAVAQLEERLEGLRWQWLPYSPSGLPLAQQIESALARRPETDVFVLGNHGLVIGASDACQLESLLIEVQRRIATPARHAHPAGYSILARVCADSHWVIPDDNDVHVLSTDPVSQIILAGGLLYPCQAIFRSSGDPALLYRPVLLTDIAAPEYAGRPFLLLGNYGVVFNRSAGPAETETLSGLARVVRRIPATATIRYLTNGEVAALSPQSLSRYRDLANARVAQSDARVTAPSPEFAPRPASGFRMSSHS